MSDVESHLAEIRVIIGGPLPTVYETFLIQNVERVRNEVLMLYEAASIVERNTTYEVQRYVPELLAVGDDSGGSLLVLRHADALATPYIIDSGAVVPNGLAESLRQLATSWQTWADAGFPLPGWPALPDDGGVS